MLRNTAAGQCKPNAKSGFKTVARQAYAGRGEYILAAYRDDINERVSSLMIAAGVGQKMSLRTAYPVLWSANQIPFQIKSVDEWPIQVECTIRGKFGEAPLSFFPADYFCMKKQYLSNQIKELSLAFFAYEQVCNPWEGKFAEQEGVKLSMEHMESIFPLWEHDTFPDDYRISGNVLKLQEVTTFAQPAMITTISLGPIGLLDVFCMKSRMDRVPKIGELISASGWLQGRAPEHT